MLLIGGSRALAAMTRIDIIMKIIAPIEISDVDFAFPARALEWMPALDEIPVEFGKV